MQFSHLQKKAAQEIIASFIYRISNNQRAAATSWADMKESLSPPAQDLAHTVRSLEPKSYDHTREKIGHSSKQNLVVIRNQTFRTTSDTQTLPARLLPANTFRAFRSLNRKLQKDTGRKLLVKSGYRSPAYQLYIFLYNLKQNEWDVRETLKTVALPGYSEHAGTPQAIDVRAKRHIGPEDTYDFARTPEYRWMKNNARDFGFELSYPKNNSSGAGFEPWHWRHSHPLS